VKHKEGHKKIQVPTKKIFDLLAFKMVIGEKLVVASLMGGRYLSLEEKRMNSDQKDTVLQVLHVMTRG
jgi:hypothetical protein